MRREVVPVKYDDSNYWVLKYKNKDNCYVSTTWAGADTFANAEEARYYANNHYRNKLFCREIEQ